jgi:hypothetical protein
MRDLISNGGDQHSPTNIAEELPAGTWRIHDVKGIVQEASRRGKA